MNETAKKALFAAVGAPVVTVRTVGGRVQEAIEGGATKLIDWIGADVNAWAHEGEKILHSLSDRGEDLASRVDIEQIQRIRDQLEEMLEAWRASFRPEKQAIRVEEKTSAEDTGSTAPTKPAAVEPSAKKPVTTKPSVRKPAAKPAAKKAAGTKVGPAKPESQEKVEAK